MFSKVKKVFSSIESMGKELSELRSEMNKINEIKNKIQSIEENINDIREENKMNQIMHRRALLKLRLDNYNNYRSAAINDFDHFFEPQSNTGNSFKPQNDKKRSPSLY